MKISLKNYNNLLSQIQKIIKKTQENIVKNVNHEKVVMSWQLGKIIDEHLIENDRADYGAQLFKQIEKDTAITGRTLYQMRSFYKTYPSLPEAEKKLSWSHYRNLSSVKDEEKRKYLEDLTINNNFGSAKLQREITKLNSRKKNLKEKSLKKKSTKLSVQRGLLFTYKIAAMPASSASFIDCGFNIFTEIKTSLKNDGEIVESVKKSETFGLKKSTAQPQQIHCYKAFLDKVVDGDTLHVTLDLGFKIRHKEILRLAKINAPEIATTEGKKSAEALKEILQGVEFLIVKTNKTDIYGRYVADVFFVQGGGKVNAQKVADEGVYLSQLLLDKGLVEVY